MNKNNFKKMKRLVVIFLVIFTVFALSACEKKPTDEELLAAARPLVEQSVLVNDIFYGKGIPYITENVGITAQAMGNYSPADKEFLSANGIENTDDLRKLVSKVYSSGVCNVIFTTKLSSVSDGTVYAGYAEYIDLTSGLCVYTKRENYINAEVEYDFDSMEVIEKTSDKARVKIEVKLSQTKGYQIREKEFDMIKTEDGEWLLDSMTYIAWDDEAEIEYKAIDD